MKASEEESPVEGCDGVFVFFDVDDEVAVVVEVEEEEEALPAVLWRSEGGIFMCICVRGRWESESR